MRAGTDAPVNPRSLPPTSDDVPSESAHVATAEPVGRQACTQGGKGCDGMTDTPAGAADGLAPRKTREARDRGGVSPLLVVDSDHADIDQPRPWGHPLDRGTDYVVQTPRVAREHARLWQTLGDRSREGTGWTHGGIMGTASTPTQLFCAPADVERIQRLSTEPPASVERTATESRLGA